jgi:hypothetical protein
MSAPSLEEQLAWVEEEIGWRQQRVAWQREHGREPFETDIAGLATLTAVRQSLLVLRQAVR